VHLRHKRDQFKRDLPIDQQPKYVRYPPPNTTTNTTSPPDTPSAPPSDPFLKAKSPQSVADMKLLAEERLAYKIENPVASTWIDFKEIWRKKKHDRMNEIKSQ
jgi:hypothetical protein